MTQPPKEDNKLIIKLILIQLTMSIGQIIAKSESPVGVKPMTMTIIWKGRQSFRKSENSEYFKILFCSRLHGQCHWDHWWWWWWLWLFKPLTPGAFCQKRYSRTFWLDISQTSFNLVKKAFATQQLAFLSTSIVFYDNLAWACTEIKIFRLFDFFKFFLPFLFLLFFSFCCCSDWPSTGLPCS